MLDVARLCYCLSMVACKLVGLLFFRGVSNVVKELGDVLFVSGNLSRETMGGILGVGSGSG